MVEVTGIRFKEVGKIYYFDFDGLKVKNGDHVIVETSRGIEYGTVVIARKQVTDDEIVPPLKKILRIANEKDEETIRKNKEMERDALKICQEKVREHNLEMKLIDVEYTFDHNKILFYFTAEGRVDFRELVRDLAGVFKTRIELRQIGVRDESKMLGGLGICGRQLCCNLFLSDFAPVSIKMAKEQNLSLNSSKISGACGRLMCCLRYEHETYEREIAQTPKVGAKVSTKDGVGTVCDAHLLTGYLKVKFTEDKGETIKTYHRDDVKIIPKKD